MSALPNDEHAERALLGHTLHLGRIPEGVNGLASSDFYRPANETVWAAMRALSDQSKPCDLPSVLTYLDKLGQLERGKAQHSSRKVTDLGLIELQQAPPIVDPAHAAENILQHAQRRRMIVLHQRGLQQASDPTIELGELLRRTEEELGRVAGAPAEEPQQRGGWRELDLTPVLDGTWKPPEPTIGRRSDGRGLFYPGKSHTAIGETESAKTWFALSVALDELAAGNHVLFIDFEDDVGSIVNRLLAISGQSTAMISGRFHYLRPEGDLRASGNQAALTEQLHTYRPTLTINDGTTEAMVMHGLNPLDNADVAIFNMLLIRPQTDAGAAAVALDHVTKDRENRGRYAIGAVHKLNAVSGAGYVLENRAPFGIGLTGRSAIKIAKDRLGQLRPHALRSSNSMHWYGDLVLESHDRDFAEVSVEPPHERDEEFRPTALMKQIAELLAEKGPLSKNKIETAIRGKTDYKRQALTLLILDGYVSDGDAKNPHQLLKPFEADK